MQASPLDIIITLLYPFLGVIFLVAGILICIWLVVKVESEEDLPLSRLALTIVIMALLLGFGLQLILTMLI